MQSSRAPSDILVSQDIPSLPPPCAQVMVPTLGILEENEPVPAPAHKTAWKQLPTHIWEEEEEEGS